MDVAFFEGGEEGGFEFGGDGELSGVGGDDGLGVGVGGAVG